MAGKASGQLAKYGGSVVLALPNFIRQEAELEKGDRVAIWSPARGVIVFEKMAPVPDGESVRSWMAEVYIQAQVLMDRMRTVGQGKMELEDWPCCLCGKDGAGIEYKRLRLCLKCETTVAMGFSAEGKKIFEVQNGKRD